MHKKEHTKQSDFAECVLFLLCFGHTAVTAMKKLSDFYWFKMRRYEKERR